eukprot:1177177-Rhodomonas_salina.3
MANATSRQPRGVPPLAGHRYVFLCSILSNIDYVSPVTVTSSILRPRSRPRDCCKPRAARPIAQRRCHVSSSEMAPSSPLCEISTTASGTMNAALASNSHRYRPSESAKT